MSSDNLSLGDVIRLTSFRTHAAIDVKALKKSAGERPKFVMLSQDYAANKGKVFVAVLIGIEDKIGTNAIDCTDAFHRMGWISKKQRPQLVPIPLPLKPNDERIKEQAQYLAKIRETWHTGTFTKQHYGWNFTGVYAAGYQVKWEGWGELYEIGEN